VTTDAEQSGLKRLLASCVTRPGGTVAMIVPDERAGDTIFLDPGVIDGLRFVRAEVVTPNWSFLAVAEKAERSSPAAS
jgi:hypothetical protein